MTPEQMDALTLAELEALAARLRKAVDTIAEARALLGATPMPATPPPVASIPGAVSRLPPNLPTTAPVWTPEEQALRAKLRAQKIQEAEAEAASHEARHREAVAS